jgi:hypothetical protein
MNTCNDLINLVIKCVLHFGGALPTLESLYTLLLLLLLPLLSFLLLLPLLSHSDLAQLRRKIAKILYTKTFITLEPSSTTISVTYCLDSDLVVCRWKHVKNR